MDAIGYNAKLFIGLHIDSNLDTTGATFYAEAGLSGQIFETDFDIASAGVQAVATSSGLMSLTAWLGVFLLDPRSMRQVPYYVIAVQYQEAVCFLSCTLFLDLLSARADSSKNRPCFNFRPGMLAS